MSFLRRATPCRICSKASFRKNNFPDKGIPKEIEEALAANPDVSVAGVVGRKDPSRGEVAVAFVELVDGATFDESSLRTWCRDRIAQFKVPKTIIALDELPRNPTGKILRRELAKLVIEEQVS